ncbi:hypothetical protein MMC06_002333 [Schaereria dolodes]|nr:hypothetical protein [Schaereria dolodes]
MSKRVVITRLLVSCTIKPGHEKESNELEDEISSDNENLNHGSDHKGDSDENDGRLAATLDHILDGERGVVSFGIEDDSEDNDDYEGYGTEAYHPEIDYLSKIMVGPPRAPERTAAAALYRQ